LRGDGLCRGGVPLHHHSRSLRYFFEERWKAGCCRPFFVGWSVSVPLRRRSGGSPAENLHGVTCFAPAGSGGLAAVSTSSVPRCRTFVLRGSPRTPRSVPGVSPPENLHGVACFAPASSGGLAAVSTSSVPRCRTFVLRESPRTPSSLPGATSEDAGGMSGEKCAAKPG